MTLRSDHMTRPWSCLKAVCLFLSIAQLSQSLDKCTDNNTVLQEISWSASCPAVFQGRLGPGADCTASWAGLLCPIACGLCQDFYGNATCSAEEMQTNRQVLVDVLHGFNLCADCTATGYEDQPVEFIVKASNDEMGAVPGGSYSTTDSRDPCLYPGVVCDRCAKAVQLGWGYPSDYPFSGFLSHSLFEMDKLYWLFLQSGVRITAGDDAPAEAWKRLTSLTTLFLVGIGKGPMPPLNEMPQVQWIRLLSTSFTGNVSSLIGGSGVVSYSVRQHEVPFEPSELSEIVCNMADIEVLDVELNNLYGSLPPCMINLTRLGNLYLTDNDLHGPLDPAIRASTPVFKISATGNRFSGTLPAALSSMFSMDTFLVTNNRLSGSVPDLSAMASLLIVDFSGNQFTSAGNLPDTITSLPFANNKFRTLPVEWWVLDAVRSIDLSGNLLSWWPGAGVYRRGTVGPDGSLNGCNVPPEFEHFQWPSMQTILLSGNPMVGEEVRDVLGSFAYLPLVQQVDISNCSLVGSVNNENNGMFAIIEPTFHCEMLEQTPYSGLVVLEASNNYITGLEGPPWTFLQQVGLRNNNLEYMHPGWFQAGAPFVQDYRENPDLRIDVDAYDEATCVAGAQGLRGDPGTFDPANSNINPDQTECMTVCTATRIVYTDSTVNISSMCRCQAGWYGAGVTCERSPVNFWSAAGSSAPTECPGNSTTEGLDTQSHVEDCTCNPGFFRVLTEGSLRCEVCPTNTFRSTSGAKQVSECDGCPAGTYSEEGATGCEECPLGTRSAGSVGQGCRECEPGQFAQEIGISICSECELSTYQPEFAAVDCISCPGTGRSTFFVPDESDVNNTLILEARAAISIDQCGCEPGRRWLNGECITCGAGEQEGLICPGGVDNSAVRLARGYFSDESPISVYRCWENERCPGDRKPGDSCAEGRRGLLCAQCQDGKMPGEGGTCVPCSTGFSALAPIAGAGAVAVLVFMYIALEVQRERKGLHSENLLVLTSVMSVLITCMQQMGVISLISIEWRNPLKACLNAMRLLTFDIEVLRLGCVGPVRPLQLYVLRLTMIFIGIIVLFGIHALRVVLFKKMQFKKHRSTLVAAVGVLSTIFYTSVVTSMTLPMQCRQHPNKSWTVRSYPSVLCWDSDVHSIMMVFSVCSLIVPIGYIVAVCHVVWQFPIKAADGNQDFLETYRFLFMRFKAEAYMYVPVPILRACFLGFVPVIPDAVLTIFIVQLLLLAYVYSLDRTRPWRAAGLNSLDYLFTISILILMCAGLVMVDNTEEGAKERLAWLCFFALALVLITVPGIIFYKLFFFLLPHAKPFQFFLCHHKHGAGAFTRLLKLYLTPKIGRRKRVFVDADNLGNLNVLFRHVSEETENLVAIASRELLYRPWCAGEITVAYHRGLNVIPVRMADYAVMEAATIEQYNLSVDTSALATYGIRLEMVKQTLEWVQDLMYVRMQKHLSHRGVEDLCKVLQHTKIQKTTQVIEIDESSEKDKKEETPYVILPDHHSSESVASAMVLEKMIVPLMAAMNHTQLPYAMALPGTIHHHTDRAICILSAGCLEQRDYVRNLDEIAALNARCIPVVAQETFRFPSKRALANAACVSDGNEQRLLSFLHDMFKEIATSFDAQNAAETVLQVGCQKILEQLLRRNIVHASTSLVVAIPATPAGQLQTTTSGPNIPEKTESQRYWRRGSHSSDSDEEYKNKDSVQADGSQPDLLKGLHDEHADFFC